MFLTKDLCNHQVLYFGGGEIQGGSCIHPQPRMSRDVDVYVGLDRGMRIQGYHWPWVRGSVVEVLFPVTDMRAPAPSQVLAYKEMVEYLCNCLQEGACVHVGCIGGHGRTGTLLAAIAHTFGEHDAIAYVRSEHCRKAVETQEQVDFLVDWLGCPAADPWKRR